MAYTARFVRGADSLSFGSGTGYSLGLDFRPPSPAVDRVYSGGTSANRLGGSALVSAKAGNRQMDLPVKITATSETHAKLLVRKLIGFLNKSSSETLYLEIKFNSLVEPMWGQFGAPIRYEVESADVRAGDLYETVGISSAPVFWLPVLLNVKPFGLGKSQKLCTAVGGIYQDYIGVGDGRSRGTTVGLVATNMFTNPAFSHATWNNGWTASGITAEQNTDARFIALDYASAHLYKTAGADPRYYQTITYANVNTHTLSFYAKKPDGSAVTATDCACWYNAAAVAATYTAVANGWYRVSASFAAVIGNITTGVSVLTDIYVDAFLVQEADYLGTPFYGSMLGCSWSGTAHASSSVRATGILSAPLDTLVNLSQGSISATFRLDVASTTTATQVIFSTFDATHAATLYGSYNFADDKFYLGDGTNTIATAAQNFAAGTVINLVFTWGASGLRIYKDGSSTPAATGATYTVPSAGANACIGCLYAGASALMGAFLGFTAYDVELTAAQAAAIGTAAVAAAASGIVDYIPWLWTKDGDNAVDNCNDTNKDNFAVAAGVPGDEPARTLIDGQLSAAIVTVGTLYLCNVDHTAFIRPSELYDEQQGSADANSSGGEYLQEVATTAYQTNMFFYLSRVAQDAIAGRKFYGFIRFYDAGSGVTAYPYFSLGSSSHVGTTKTLTTSAAFNLPAVPAMNFPSAESYFTDRGVLSNPAGALGAIITRTGANANWRTDFYTCLYSPMVAISGAAGLEAFVLDGSQIQDYDPATRLVGGSGVLATGAEIELMPDRYNHLMSLMGNAATASAIATTLTYYAINVTPRWGLM